MARAFDARCRRRGWMPRSSPPRIARSAAVRSVAARTGTRPDDSAGTRAATGPQRWWMPLAAAATIGAVALGILQTMPQHESVIAPPGERHACARGRTHGCSRRTRRATQLLLKEKRDAAGAVAEADAARTPAAAAPSATSLAGARKQVGRDGRAAARRTASRLPPHRSPRHPGRRPLRNATAPPPSSASVASGTPAVPRGEESRIGTNRRNPPI